MALVVAAVVSGSAAGVSGWRHNDAEVERAPGQFAPRTAPVPPLGPPADVAIRALIARLPLVDDPQLSEVTLPELSGKLLSYDLRVESFEGPDITEAMWQGAILTGIVADRLAASGAQLGDVQATLVSPHGERQPVGGAIGNMVRDQAFDIPAAEELDQIADRLESAGMTPARVATVGGLQPAVVIRAVTRNASEAAQRYSEDQIGTLQGLLARDPRSLEGIYLEIEDVHGDPVVISALASRVGGAMIWVRPDLDKRPRRGLMPIPERAES